MKNIIKRRYHVCILILILNGFCEKLLAQPAMADSAAMKSTMTRFYEGLNIHDVEEIVSVYANDIDYINAFGEWHAGKQSRQQALTKFHEDRTRNTYKTIKFEKIRFLKPNVAVALVRQTSTVGNLGTFVMTKESGNWLIVSFSNVPNKLPESSGKKK